jgi:hypothetical protein
MRKDSITTESGPTIDYELNRLLSDYERSVEDAAMARNRVTISELRRDASQTALYNYITNKLGKNNG